MLRNQIKCLSNRKQIICITEPIALIITFFIDYLDFEPNSCFLKLRRVRQQRKLLLINKKVVFEAVFGIDLALNRATDQRFD